MGSCKKKATDPDYCGAAWATQISAEVTALSNAATAYSANPTPTTCNAFKTAYQDYLDALKPFSNCDAWTEEQQNELQDEIAAAELEISTLCEQ